MKNLEKFEAKVEELVNDFTDERKIKETELSFNKAIYEMAENEVSPDSDEGKRFNFKTNILSKIGRKIANLLTIEFKITFAGVTLCYLRIPKLEDVQEDIEVNFAKNIKKLNKDEK